jgi:hypothetical protein
MKIYNWRRKLAATLVGCGLLSPSVATAAELDTNLIVNPGFEQVDLGFTSYYNAPLILGWTSISGYGFAYSHDFDQTGVPGFANGTLPSGGLWYFTPGNSLRHSYQDAIFQDIDVSGGATLAAISSGSATFSLSGFFSTYGAQADRAFVQADFYNEPGDLVGTAQISTPNGTVLQDWTEFSASGAVPAGTRVVQISAWGEVAAGSEGSADGYQDNLDFRILTTSSSADFDNDGDVDGSDMLAWQRGSGLASGANKSQGDANGDGDVDGDDYGVWVNQFGGGGAVGALTAVPEPSWIALAASGAAAGLSAVRTRWRKIFQQGR